MLLQNIKRKQLPFLPFLKAEVIAEISEKLAPIFELNRDMTLSNLEKVKATITSIQIEYLNTIETTLRKVTDNAVFLKNSILIPLKRILQIA
ncbi:hypothetical protein NBT05_13175 [Aquimarina sp. ERC-38]|uniref:hypothetical protein n=1 Tax=Aquimarina sp. ERC-38 TaxID=2949996 RepID=UPI002245E374|nr:hypothetical protein [Aquimarina sp. ERC-38]UZO79896.1 hypothetical protein NBT05_13175 [Aquimarina sp. ERC-38]